MPRERPQQLRGFNHELLKTLPDRLGSDIYTGDLHANSEFNTADDPSRRLAVRAPVREHPTWLEDLQAGCPMRFRIIQKSDAYLRPYNFWVRLLCLLEARRQSRMRSFAPACPH